MKTFIVYDLNTGLPIVDEAIKAEWTRVETAEEALSRFTVASPRRAFGSVGRRGADRTWDRAGAARKSVGLLYL